MGQHILAVAEMRGGEFRTVTQEVVAEARRLAEALGGEAIALAIGSSISETALELGQWGAQRCVVADDVRFEQYAPEGYTAAIAAAAEANDVSAILLPASRQGKDLAPRVAARLGIGLLVETTALDIEDGVLVATRPAYAGKVQIKVRSSGPMVVASLRPKAFGQPTPGEPLSSIEALSFSVEDGSLQTRITAFEASAGKKVDLTEADIIVSGGRGMKGPENYSVLEELANVLGGCVGASRAAVDLGWRPHEDQVGQTGKTVNPSLYIACGISGQIQHLAGMRTSKTIVAINKDPEAPIFGLATYGIVGDLFDIVPRLTEAVRQIKALEK